MITPAALPAIAPTGTCFRSFCEASGLTVGPALIDDSMDEPAELFGFGSFTRLPVGKVVKKVVDLLDEELLPEPVTELAAVTGGGFDTAPGAFCIMTYSTVNGVEPELP